MTSKMQSDFIAVTVQQVIILTLASQVASSDALNTDGIHLRHAPCDSYHYRYLLALRDTQNCIGENEVWGMLSSIYYTPNGPYCMKQAIMLMSETFSDPKHNPEYCICNGSNTIWRYPNGLTEHTQDCTYNDQLYVYLRERHFHMNHPIYYQQAPHCSTHHSVWPALASIGSDICRNDIVLQVASAFQSSGDKCSCLRNTEVGSETQQPPYPSNQPTSSPRVPSDHCLQYQSYAYLYNLSHNVSLCVSVNNMWHYLADVQQRDIDCRKEIIDHMGSIFHDFQQSPDFCSCVVHNIQHDTTRPQNMEHNYCMKYHEEYKLLYDEIYSRSPQPCRSHQYLWRKLLLINVGELEKDCREDFIRYAAAIYKMPENDPCSCSHASGSRTVSVMSTVATSGTLETTETSTSLPETTPTTTSTSMPETITPTTTSTSMPETTTPTTTSTSLQETTTPTTTSSSLPETTTPTTTIKLVTDEALIGVHICNKASTIFTIAHNISISHPGAPVCITGGNNSSEALVFLCCNINSTATWRKGENVIEICNMIPLYTPIATFTPDGAYESNEWPAGIFLGCLPNGFKFAAQTCKYGIQIKHFESGGILSNNNTYFVVRW